MNPNCSFGSWTIDLARSRFLQIQNDPGIFYIDFGSFRIVLAKCHEVLFPSKMADFDEIYEVEDEEEPYIEESLTVSVPDPVIVRGAGNVTM